MKNIILFVWGFVLLSIFSSCKKDVPRGTQVPKNVIEVEGIGKIGQMVKYYNFSDKFLPCRDLGFSDNEGFGRWCVEEKGFLIFQVRKNATVTMRLDFKSFVSENHKENIFQLKASGTDCGVFTITADSTIYLNLDQRHITDNNAVEMELIPLNPKSPQELGINGDGRKIGFGLKSVTLWAYYPVEE